MFDRLFASALLAFPFAACGDDGSAAADAGTPDAPVLFQPVTLTFAANVGGSGAACGTTYDDIGMTQTQIEVADLRFFVSNVRLLDGASEVPMIIYPDDTWQHDDVALLDFEDGSGACADTGNSGLNATIEGGVGRAGNYDGIVFDLGVPFELNHVNADTAPAPLNTPAMQWNWQGGYKFLRLDLRNQNTPPGNVFNVHLGSTGCASPSPADPPDAECGKPNVPTIRLTGFDPDADTITLDIAALLAGTDVSVNTMDTPPGCMSFPPDVDDCAQIFPNLGLAWDTGACADGCANQTLFAVN